MTGADASTAAGLPGPSVAGAGRPGPSVAVVGGGISGLAAAWELVGHAGTGRVTVLEATDRFGGKIDSADFAGRRVELGPDAFVVRRPEALELCAELGMSDDLVAPGASSAGVWSGERLHDLPAGLALGVPTRIGPLARSGILSAAGLGRVAVDLATPRWTAPASIGEDEAIGSLVARRLGREVVDKLADPLIGGIHAGSVDTMSASAVFPPLLEAAAKPGSLARNLRRWSLGDASRSGAADTDDAITADQRREVTAVFSSPRQGVSHLVERLCAALTERGAVLRPSTAVRAVTATGSGGWRIDTGTEEIEVDAVVLALPAPAAAAVVRQADPELARRLEAISYASVSLVTLRFAPGALGTALSGTGFLVPRISGALLTACTYLSVKWPALAHPDDVLVRVSAGRFGDTRALELDDDALAARAVEELTPMLSLRAPPLEWRVARFADAFPQYDVGHLERVSALEEQVARHGSLAVAGAALRGVGIPACIGSGRRAARLALAGVGTASQQSAR